MTGTQISKTPQIPRIHCYAASFGSDLAKNLIHEHGKKRGTVLDPFAGSGTTLIQALIADMSCIGIDVDPIAVLLCRVQTRSYKQNWLQRVEAQALEAVDHIEDELQRKKIDGRKIKKDTSFSVNGYCAKIPDKSEVDYWFSSNHKIVLASLVAHLNRIKNKREKDLMAVSLSSSIIRKWPNTLSLAMDIDHSRPHKAEPEINSLVKSLNLFRRVFKSVVKSLGQTSPMIEKSAGRVSVFHGDSIDVTSGLNMESSIDLILTSPPYVNAIDYPRSHKFAEWWLTPDRDLCQREYYIGLRGNSGEAEVFFGQATGLVPKYVDQLKWLHKIDPSAANRLWRYVVDMADLISNCFNLLKKNGKAVFVLADNRIGGKVVPVVDIVSALFQEAGFRRIAVHQRQIHSSRRRYPFGFKGVMDSESVIIATR